MCKVVFVSFVWLKVKKFSFDKKKFLRQNKKTGKKLGYDKFSNRVRTRFSKNVVKSFFVNDFMVDKKGFDIFHISDVDKNVRNIENG